MTGTIRDIRYKPPLSYRGIRFFSLIFLTIGQFSSILYGIGRLYKYLEMPNPYTDIMPVCNALIILGQLSLPLLLVSVFSELLRQSDHIIRILVTNLILALIVGVVYSIVFPAVVQGVLLVTAGIIPEAGAALLPKLVHTDLLNSISNILPSSFKGFEGIVQTIVNAVPPSVIDDLVSSGGVQETLKLFLAPDKLDYHALAINYAPALMLQNANVNVFMDISLCSLTYFFAVYTPKKIKKTRLMFFRLLAVFPIGYAILSFIVTGLARNGWVTLTMNQASLLTCRKPACFLVFAAVVLFVKYEDAAAQEKQLSAKEYEKYKNSNLIDLHFSFQLSIVLAVISVSEFILSYVPSMESWGFGYFKWMFLGIPFLWLFSFKKQPKHKWLDIYVPVYLTVHYFLMFIIIIGTFFMFLEDLTGIPVDGILSWIL